MITGKNRRISFSMISFFILLSCSKSDQPTKKSAFILNAYTYTLTDTTGVNHTYSDTAMYYPDSNKYYLAGNPVPFVAVASVSPRDTGNHQLLQFNFSDHKSSGRNALSFSLPYFQATLSGTNNFSKTPLLLEWDRVFYDAIQPQPPAVSGGTVYLASFTTSTNISDSTGGFLTGNFTISATTVDSGKIGITGKFTNLPTNYSP